MPPTKSRQFNPYIFISLMILSIGVLIGWQGWYIGNIAPVTSQLLALFLASLILWLKVAIDWPSLITLIGLGLLPGLTYSEVFTLSFGNTTFVFLFFTFIVTYALEQTYALKRVIAWAMNSRFAQVSAERFIFAFLSVVLLLASFISPTILFMIVFPLYEEIMHQFDLKKGDRRASQLLIALFSTIAIGTAMTPINHVFAITAMGIYSSASDVTISNAQYMSFAVPAGLVIYLLLLFSLKYLWHFDLSDIQIKTVHSLKDLPPVDTQERWTIGVFIAMVLMWIVPELMGGLWPNVALFFKTAGIAFPPMLCCLLLAGIHLQGKPLIHLPEAIQRGVYWPSLLIVAATLSLGNVLTNPEFGVTQLIESHLGTLLIGLTPIMMCLLFITWAGVQTNFASNLVTTTMVTTILTTVAATQMTQNFNVGVVACLIGFIASIALMTPPAMPYVAISIGSNWTSSRDCLKYGGWILVISILIATFLAYPLGHYLIPLP